MGCYCITGCGHGFHCYNPIPQNKRTQTTVEQQQTATNGGSRHSFIAECPSGASYGCSHGIIAKTAGSRGRAKKSR